jgi:hypothetical protein
MESAVTNGNGQAPQGGYVDIGARINSIAGSILSTGLAAFATIAVTINAYAESSRPLRQQLILVGLIGLHLLMIPKLWLGREIKIYLTFLCYMFLSLLWTENVPLAMDTLTLAINFALIATLFGALVAYHERRAVFVGMLGGFLIAAAYYTLTQRFPFVYPDGFSYNTIAGMYLFGLFATILFGWFSRRMVIPIAIGLVLLLLVAATTSIKTNVGIALGTGAVAILYMRHFIKAIRRTLILIVVFVALIGVAINSNDALVERVNAGVERVGKGVQILLAREDAAGDTALGERQQWKDEGLRGWVLNPVFGYGVEGFRSDYGVTSHSTPVDLLYNSGVIGFGLFYATLLSIGWRLYRATEAATSALRAYIAALLICYLFISLSGTMYYDAFLAIYVAASGALLSPTFASLRWLRSSALGEG